MPNNSYRWGPNPSGNYQKVILPWHRPETVAQHEENIRALERIDWGGAEGTRWATIVIASYDSTDASKRTADYVCSNSNAATIVNTAISTLITQQTGSATPLGRIVLLEGTYNVGTTAIGSNGLNGKALHIQGMGGMGRSDTIGGTRIVATSGAAISVAGSGVGGGSSLMLSDLQLVNSASGSPTVSVIDCPITVTRCHITNNSSGGCIVESDTTGSSAQTLIFDNAIYSASGATVAVAVSGGASIDQPCIVSNNYIKIAGATIAVRGANQISTVPQYIVSDNVIKGSGAASSVGVQINGNSTESCIIANNYIYAVATGVLAAGYRHIITGNLIESCTVGYDSGAFNPQFHYIVGNHFVSITSVGARFGSAAGTVMQEGTIAFNRFSNSGAATAVVIGHANCTNCGVFYNDYYGCAAYLSDSGTGTRTEGWFLTAASLPAHATRHETGGTDALTGLLDANARVGVRKNSAGSTFLRRRINFIEGTNVTLTVADDSSSEEVDVTINSSGGGGGGGGSAVTNSVNQTAHGLVLGDVVRFDGTNYVKAQADAVGNADVVGIVSAVADADNFTLLTDGLITGLSGFIGGTVYFLSDVTAGGLTAAEPTASGRVSKPLFIATSATQGYFVNWRGVVVGVTTTTFVPTGATLFNHFNLR